MRSLPLVFLAAAASACQDYSVKPGDTCVSVAGHTETTVPFVTFKSDGAGCTSRTLFPGEAMSCCETPDYPAPGCAFYNVTAGDSCDAIAAKFNTDVANVTEGGQPCPTWSLHPGDTVTVCKGEPPPPLPPNCTAHAVASGETCMRIAGHYKTTVKAVSTTSGEPCDVSPLQVGQLLVVCPTSDYPAYPDCLWHSVASGDNCLSVAKQFKADVANVTEGGAACPWQLFIDDTLLVCPYV
jgi:hypothetical protein